MFSIVISILLLFFAGKLFFYSAILLFRWFSSGRWKSISLRQVGLFFGVVAVIGACEFFVPSLAITGLQRPNMAEPHRFVQNRAWSDAPMTYEDVSKLAPWLSHLGYLEEEDFIAYLDANLEQANSLVARKKQEDTSNSVLFSRVVKNQIKELSTIIGGIEKTRENVEELFENGKVTFYQAAEFELKYQLEVAEHEAARAIKEYTVSETALNDFKAQYEDGQLEYSNPAYRALRNTNVIKQSRKTYTQGRLDDRQKHAAEVQSYLAAFDPEDAFPNLLRPVAVYAEKSDFKYWFRDSTQRGPGLQKSVLRWGRHISDAVTGYQRAPRKLVEEQSCYILISDNDGYPKAQKLCEVFAVLDIHYDLTAENCEDSTLAAGSPYQFIRFGKTAPSNACIEKWIYPHLNVVYEDGKITVHEPRPSGVSDQGWQLYGSPISTWTVFYDGVEKPLLHSASFIWDGESDVLTSLKLRHEPQPQVQFPRIWPDFSLGAFGLTLQAAISGSALENHQRFSSILIDNIRLDNQPEYASAFVSSGDLLLREATATDNANPSKLRGGIRARQFALALDMKNEVFSKATKTPESNPASSKQVCVVPSFGPYRLEVAREKVSQKVSLDEVFDSTKAPLCEKYQGVNALFQGLWGFSRKAIWFR